MLFSFDLLLPSWVDRRNKFCLGKCLLSSTRSDLPGAAPSGSVRLRGGHRASGERCPRDEYQWIRLEATDTTRVGASYLVLVTNPPFAK